MIGLPVEQVDRMEPNEEGQFWAAFERVLCHDDGQAARLHLAAGAPIYYRDDCFPSCIVREWPEGRRELVVIDMVTGHVSIIQAL